MSAPPAALIFSCEHGGNNVPAEFAALFGSRAAQRRLRGHEGFDLGALALARRLAAAFDAPLVASTLTRLLVDMNRAATNPAAFSDLSRGLAREQRHDLIETMHEPHRAHVAAAVQAALARYGCAYHVAVHSFSPTWRGVDRAADIGLLYDPSRALERAFCARWRRELLTGSRQLRVRRNYPYRGTSDGMTTWLRRVHGNAAYCGIELEINQRTLRAAGVELSRCLADSLAQSLRLSMRSA